MMKDEIKTPANPKNSITQSVKDDLAALKSSPLVRKELLQAVSGYVLDIKTGKLSLVEG
jgi:carbonic anhydrase